MAPSILVTASGLDRRGKPDDDEAVVVAPLPAACPGPAPRDLHPLTTQLIRSRRVTPKIAEPHIAVARTHPVGFMGFAKQAACTG
jgi:hypothetical protein